MLMTYYLDLLTFDLYWVILFNIFWALTSVCVAGAGIAPLIAKGGPDPIGVPKAPHNDIKEDNNFWKSLKIYHPE